MSSHMLKTGRRGNPFCKDTHDLFATLIVSLELKTNTRLFKSYPNSFTTDDAATNLASLRFSQSNRLPDPNDPGRIITTTTTTTFSMGRDIAKGICQHFLDARLIENAVDRDSTQFKDRGIFQLTPKGLHVLERFVTKNGISAQSLVQVFVAQPLLVRLVQIERRPNDDDIELTRRTLEHVWRAFTGRRQANYVTPWIESAALATAREARPFNETPPKSLTFDRSIGVEVQDVIEKLAVGAPSSAPPNKFGLSLVRHVFTATSAVEWLIDFATVVCREEAAELLAQFVRLGFMRLHADRSKPGDKIALVEARADPRYPGTGGSTVAEFRWGSRVLYAFTEEGRRVSGLHEPGSAAAKAIAETGSNDDDASSTKSGQRGHGSGHTPATAIQPSGLDAAVDAQLITRRLADMFRQDDMGPNGWGKDAHSSNAKLKTILDEPALRALFREYLRSTYSEENLAFYLEVAEFKRRFATTSSASGGKTADRDPKAKKSANASTAMEAHQNAVVMAALAIYHKYLAPQSAYELNIDHQLRADVRETCDEGDLTQQVINFIQKAQLDVNGANTVGRPSTSGEPTAASPEHPNIVLRATQAHPTAASPSLTSQVQALMRHYERIQDHIFRLLATDQVPRFIRSPKMTELMAAAASEGGASPASSSPPPPKRD